METPWDPGIESSMSIESTGVSTRPGRGICEPSTRFSINLYAKIYVKNSSDGQKVEKKNCFRRLLAQTRSQKMNTVVVQSCAGCEMRNSANGPFQWSYHFTQNPDNAQVHRLARRNMARWSRSFNLFTGCLECIEALMHIAVLMLDAP